MSARPAELPVVEALRTLSIFGADQGGAYRELYAPVAAVLGDDVPTRLSAYVRHWAEAATPGCIILTGNAGTGKTAVAEAYCRACGHELPKLDGPASLPGGQLVIKDLSGLAGRKERAVTMRLSCARCG